MDVREKLWQVSMTVPCLEEGVYQNMLECLTESVTWNYGDEKVKFFAFWVNRLDIADPGHFLTEKVKVYLTSCKKPLPEDFKIEPVREKDWLSESLLSFKPQEIDCFFVYGSHYTGELPQTLIPIHLNAALAFGSGEHETTKGCLKALSFLFHQDIRPQTILDMGCGSGILSIGAAKLFQKKVIASDLDPFSVTVSQENALKNGVADRIEARLGDGYAVISPHEKFDLILSNILAKPLCTMAPDLEKAVAPKGYAVLAGFLTSQEKKVEEAHKKQGFSVKKRYQLNDWVTLLLQKDE